MKSVLKSLTEVEKFRQSNEVIKKLLANNHFKQARNIGVYVNMPTEIKTEALMMEAWS